METSLSSDPPRPMIVAIHPRHPRHCYPRWTVVPNSQTRQPSRSPPVVAMLHICSSQDPRQGLINNHAKRLAGRWGRIAGTSSTCLAQSVRYLELPSRLRGLRGAGSDYPYLRPPGNHRRWPGHRGSRWQSMQRRT